MTRAGLSPIPLLKLCSTNLNSPRQSKSNQYICHRSDGTSPKLIIPSSDILRFCKASTFLHPKVTCKTASMKFPRLFLAYHVRQCIHLWIHTYIHTQTHVHYYKHHHISSMKKLIKNDSNLTADESSFSFSIWYIFVMFFDPMKMYLKYSTARSFDYCIVNLHFRSLKPKMSKL